MLDHVHALLCTATRRSNPKPYDKQNLSFVLHERSDSQAVLSLAHTLARNRVKCRKLTLPQFPATIAGDPTQACDIVLTARIGAYGSLGSCLKSVADIAEPLILRVEDESKTSVFHTFFRSPARLSLPRDTTARVMVAALVIRPDGKSTHLRIEGCFDLPNELAPLLSALETLVQAFADQWDPGRALWSEPAEIRLAHEIP